MTIVKNVTNKQIKLIILKNEKLIKDKYYSSNEIDLFNALLERYNARNLDNAVSLPDVCANIFKKCDSLDVNFNEDDIYVIEEKFAVKYQKRLELSKDDLSNGYARIDKVLYYKFRDELEKFQRMAISNGLCSSRERLTKDYDSRNAGHGKSFERISMCIEKIGINKITDSSLLEHASLNMLNEIEKVQNPTTNYGIIYYSGNKKNSLISVLEFIKITLNGGSYTDYKTEKVINVEKCKIITII